MAAAPRRAVPKDFSVKLSTGDWDYILDDVRGLIVFRARVVVIPRCRETKDRMRTFAHETMHASDPTMSEAEVERISSDVVEVLWKAGYRLQRLGR